MQQNMKLRRQDLVEPDLSYKIVGALLDVYHELGPGLKEVTYQRAVAQAFQEKRLEFEEQLFCPVKYHGLHVGSRYLDFLVNGRVIVELKCGSNFLRPHILQVKEYLTVSKLQLGIIGLFTVREIKFKRVVNIEPLVRS